MISVNFQKKIIKILRSFWILIDYIYPKNNKKIVFNSVPDFSDNSYAFYKYIKRNYPDEYECVWISSMEKGNKNDSGIKVHDVYTFIGLYHLITSKYIVSTHANKFIDFTTNAHTHINLWHGMPLKSLGLNEKIIKKKIKNRYKKLGKNAYSFATSDVFKLSLLATFGSSYSNIFITGQPRTDMIWDAENADVIDKIFNFKKYDKVIFYMPTYKEEPNGRIKQIKTKYENIFYFKDYSEREFIEYLKKNNILFLMKPHPFDEEFYVTHCDSMPKTDNFKLVLNKDFIENGFYSYEIFKYVDLMISDFSSVTVDYLILNKPVIYLNNLADEYTEQRGMILPDNTEMFMPGAKVSNFQLLLDEFSKNLYDDTYKKDRERVLPLLHKYRDDNASKRIFEMIVRKDYKL